MATINQPHFGATFTAIRGKKSSFDLLFVDKLCSCKPRGRSKRMGSRLVRKQGRLARGVLATGGMDTVVG